MKKNTYIIILVSMLLNAVGQDPQFTQFYAAPQYLNPAFTGLTKQHRFVANYRNQWPGVKKTFQTSLAAYDGRLVKINSGIGIFVMQDVAGTAGLKHSQVGLSYAYQFDLNNKSQIRAGLSASFNSKSVGFSKLVFNDMLITGSGISSEGNTYSQKNYLDINAGLLYNSEKIWFGVAAKHLNKPNVSLQSGSDPLPMDIGIHGGYRFNFKSGENKTESKPVTKAQSKPVPKPKNYIAVAFNYKHLQKYDQLDLGLYYYLEPITVGVWYRGIPFKNYSSAFVNHESMALLIGCAIPKYNLRVGYSYDLTISSLKINNTKGAHEISLVYEFGKEKTTPVRRIISHTTVPKL